MAARCPAQDCIDRIDGARRGSLPEEGRSPAASGAAMLVPVPRAEPPPTNDERTFTPGAATSGLMLPHTFGPRLEKEATAPS